MANILPLATTKKDSREIFENKMKWWLMSCQWSGLYIGNVHMVKKRIWLKIVHKIISCLVFMYILTYVSFLAYRLHFKSLFTFGWIRSFNVLVWVSAVALLLLSVMIGFGRGNLSSWCHEVSKYCDDYGLNEKIVVTLRKIPRSVISNLIINMILTGVECVIYILLLGAGEYIFFFPNEMQVLNTTSFAIVIFLKNYTYSNFSPILQIGSNIIRYEMDRANKEFEICCGEKSEETTAVSTIDLKDKETDVSKRLDKAMEQHSRICDLIGHFNNCLNHYSAASFLIGLPMSCFALYILLTVAKDTVDVVMTTLTVVMSLISILTNCILGCFVNYKAHKALDHIWKLPTEKLQESTMRKLSQLTIRLTGTSIGYTVYGFFTFTMPAVLSIIGCILTYFIVVIQFKPPEETDCTSVCNNSLPAWCVTNQTGLV